MAIFTLINLTDMKNVIILLLLCLMSACAVQAQSWKNYCPTRICVWSPQPDSEKTYGYAQRHGKYHDPKPAHELTVRMLCRAGNNYYWPKNLVITVGGVKQKVKYRPKVLTQTLFTTMAHYGDTIRIYTPDMPKMKVVEFKFDFNGDEDGAEWQSVTDPAYKSYAVRL